MGEHHDISRLPVHIADKSNPHAVTKEQLGIHVGSSACWSFRDTGLGAGTAYVAGFYVHGAAAWSTAAPQTIGTVNISYAAHAFIVLGGASTDMVVRATGTSITDAGVRTPGDTEDINTSGGALNAYFETSKKWLGQVTLTLQSGVGVSSNYGLSKYWDDSNHDFNILGWEIVGLAAKNSSLFNIELIHHKATGWTYNAGAPADSPVYADFKVAHGAESQIAADRPFAWKTSGLAYPVLGNDSEGLLFRVTTNSVNMIDLMNIQLYHDQL